MNAIEEWKSEKHSFDVWPDVLNYADRNMPTKEIPPHDLERMKWYGVLCRKHDGRGSYMLRIRIPGCELTAAQAREIANIAYEYGYSIIDITTRSNIQIQGLRINKIPRALERLNRAALSTMQTGHDNVRNVNCHPLSGIDPEELIDVRSLSYALTDLFLENREFADLPRKFNISISGQAQHSLHYWTQDISYLAYRNSDGTSTFQVLIGGTQGQGLRLGRHLPVFVDYDQVMPVTKALLTLFRTQGARDARNKTRFCFLIEKIGIARVLQYLEEHLDFALAPCTIAPTPPTDNENFIGWFKQKQDDFWAVGVAVPVGRLNWNQLDGLAVIANRWGNGTLRLTHDQSLLIAHIPTRFKHEVAVDLARYGLTSETDTITRNVVACTGKQFCNIALTETKSHACRLMEDLRRRSVVLEGIRIHMSGCPSACAQHFTADIGLKGVRIKRFLVTHEAFDVFLAGGINHHMQLAIPYKAAVDLEQLPHLIEEVVQEYCVKHLPGETFSEYWCKNLAGTSQAQVGDEDYRPPVWICNSCDLKYRAEEPPIFCPGCSALSRHFKRLDQGEEVPKGI